MPLHPQAASLLDLIASFGDPPLHEDTPENVRALRASRTRPSEEPVHEIRDVDADGVPARLYRPADTPGLGLLVYLHGGGWVIGDLDSHDNVCRSLANASGVAVLSVGYRLAPENPFPAGLMDALRATRWAYEHAARLGCEAARLAIGGDSAGANLAAVVAQLAPVPLRFQLLVYPVTDARGLTPSYEENADGCFLTADGMRWFVAHYLSGGRGAPDDPRVSPLLADDAVLRGTPRAWVLTAEYDPLRDEGVAYAERLAYVGVPVTHVQVAGMFHGFFSLADYLDDGKAAVAAAGTALRCALAPT